MRLRFRCGALLLSVLLLCLPICAIPAYAAYPNVYSCCRCAKKQIALTFDDGPHRSYTAQILDILKRYNIRATFFVVGENAKTYPELVKRELAEGHEVGNHTFSHLKLQCAQSSLLRSEMLETEELIYSITGKRTVLFRPPEGVCSKETAALAAEMNYNVILWTIDTRDWAHTPVKTIENQVLTQVKSGDIILFHDFIGKNSPTPQVLQDILPKLLAEGYQFVTVSELIASAG